MKTLILGVGNPFRRDDGIGPAVINQLQMTPLPDNTDVLDGGTDGLNLIEYIKPYDRAIIIDAVEMRQPPGTIKVFTPGEAELTITSESLSTHGFGLAAAIRLMRQLEIKTELTIIGIQPNSVEFGEGLSEPVASGIDRIITLVQKHV